MWIPRLETPRVAPIGSPDRTRAVTPLHEKQEEGHPPRAFQKLLRGSRSRAFLARLALQLFFFKRHLIPRSMGELHLQRLAIALVSRLQGLWRELAAVDTSESVVWLDDLSECWEDLLALTERAKIEGCGAISEPLTPILQLMGQYGDQAGYGLGAYLDHSAGHDWFPLPFLHLIRQLHEEAYPNTGQTPHPATGYSHLAQWNRLLDDLVRTWRLQTLSVCRVHESL